MRVLDTLGSITGKNTVSEQLASLRKVTTQDNVHLTVEGYRSLADGIFKEALSFRLAKTKGKNTHSGKKQNNKIEWRGFVSNFGVGKISLKASKKTYGSRSHPYQTKR